MKAALTLLFVFNLTLIAVAQDSYFRVITCKGQVYHSDGHNAHERIVPGTRIKAEGELILDEGSMIKLISKDRPQKLQSPGVYNLEELYYTGDKKSMSFTGKFWKYLMDGLKNSDDKDDLKKYGNQLASGGIKGYSDAASYDIVIISPIFGKIASFPLSFKWDAPQNTDATYSLRIHEENGPSVYKQETNKTTALISSQDLEIDKGNYTWQITSGENASATLNFSYEPDAETGIAERLNLISDYVEGDEREKAWIEAVVYEMEGFHYDAGQKYKALMEAYPSDLLFKKLYMLHLVKVGQLDSALKMVP